MIALGSLSSLGYGPLVGIKIIGMQFLDFFDFLTNSVMMPIAAMLTSLFVSRIVGMKRMEDEIMHGESTFRRKKIFIVMIKYLCPVFALIILISSVAMHLAGLQCKENIIYFNKRLVLTYVMDVISSYAQTNKGEKT